jgi:hypothetical protein
LPILWTNHLAPQSVLPGVRQIVQTGLKLLNPTPI